MDSQVCDQACEILRKTNDGNALAPSHLKLVEIAVNGLLNDKGKAAFSDLHDQVMKGYVKPWFCGIEHLTIDHSGCVYWKGVQVEHYSYGPDRCEECRENAEELARRCRIVEQRGEQPTVKTAIFDWPED